MRFSKIFFSSISTISDQDIRPDTGNSFELFEYHIDGVTIVGISRQSKDTKYNSAVSCFGDGNFGPKFIAFVSFAFGNTLNVWFMERVDFIFVIFLLKQNGGGIKQSINMWS